MAKSDADILIKILTAFDKGGIDQAKKAAAELSKEFEKNSKEGKQVSAWMKFMERDGIKATRMFNGLTTALQGGTTGVRGFASAARILAGVLGAGGPVMLGIAAASTAFQAISTWQKRAEEAADAAKKAADEQAQAAEDAKTAIEELDKAKAEAVQREIEGIRSKLDAASAAAKKLNGELDAMESAELALQVANIEKAVEQGVMSETDAKYEKARLRLESENRKLKRDQAAANTVAADNQKAKDDAAVAAVEAETNARAAEDLAAQAQADYEAKSSQLAQMQSKIAELEYEIRSRRGNRAMNDAYHSLKGEANRLQGPVDIAQFTMETRQRQADEARKEADEKAGVHAGMEAPESKENKAIAAARAEAARLETESRAKEINLETEALKWNNANRKAALEKEKAAEKQRNAAKEAAEKQRRQAAADREANLTPEERAKRAIAIGTRTAKITDGSGNAYQRGSDVDRAGREKVETALDSAFAEAATKGADAQEIINQLLVSLRKLNAVIPDMAIVLEEINILNGNTKILQERVKNVRGK